MQARYKYVVIGLGPSGLSVLDQLLRSGVSENEIAIMVSKDSFEKEKPTAPSRVKRSRNLFLSARKLRHHGIVKRGVDTSELENSTQSLANFWGASHLPPVFDGIEYSRYFPIKNIDSAIHLNAQMLQIQAEKQKKLTVEFPINGELLGKIDRKAVAQEWVENVENDFIHSRLSIGGYRSSKEICSNNGTCFEDCPTGALWSPKIEFNHIALKHPEIALFIDQVLEIDHIQKIIFLKQSEGVIYENVFLCAGPKNSIKILRASRISKEEIDFLYSPVVMQPFLIKAVSKRDFMNLHVLSDVLLPILTENKVKSLAQIHFPTDKLAAQIFSKVPNPFFSLLSLVPEKILMHLFRKIGIAMIFLENVKQDESRTVILERLKRSNQTLDLQLKTVSARLIKTVKVYALGGASHHTGCIYIESEKSKHGLESPIFSELKAHGIYLADGLALVEIPPGPHTNTVCVISRCLVMEALEK